MFRAKLDQNWLYLGLEEVAEIIEGDIELGEDCGLKAGKYRWNGSTFIPLPKSQQKTESGGASFESALYALIKSGTNVPAECSEWASSYEKSLDAIGRVIK